MKLARSGARASLLLALVVALLAVGGAAAHPAVWHSHAAAPLTSTASRSDKGRSWFVVGFRAGTTGAQMRAILARRGVEAVRPVLHQAHEQEGTVAVAKAKRTLAALRANRHVLSARIDGIARAAMTPNDPYFATSGWIATLPGLPAAWDTTTGSSSITVAVVDSGVDASHEDFGSRVLPGYNFVAGNTNTADDNGHGTEVAGEIAAAGNNGLGNAGVCWSCKILPVKVLDSTGAGSDQNIADGIEWAADQGAKIINVSVGATSDPGSVEQTAIQYAVNEGSLVVIAAGNAGSNDPTAGSGGYPAYYAPGINGAISVGATDYNDALYSFSDYGSWVEVAAPGVALTTKSDGTYTYTSSSNWGVSGTSFAAPVVAGEAALALSMNPSLSPAQLETDIEAHTSPVTGGNSIAGGRVDIAGLVAALSTAPLASTPASIGGSANVGQTLTASGATFTGSAPIALSYQWRRCDSTGASCADIGSATGSTYTVASADLGQTLRVVVTGTNGQGSDTSTSSQTAVVGAALTAPANTAIPTVFGTTTVGQTLTATAGTWTGNPTPTTTYQWRRCDSTGANCTDITSATGSTYTLVGIDAGSTIRVSVTATSSQGSASAASNATASIVGPPANLTGSSLSGTAAVGQTLTASAGTWAGNPTPALSYQWWRCDNTGANCASISTATAQTYTLGSSDLGQTVLVVVTASNTLGSASSTSTQTAVIVAAFTLPTNTVLPSVSGTAAVGQTLTGAQGTFAGNPTPTVTGQWQRCDSSGASCADIASATSTTYTLVTADAGKTIRFKAIATNSQGSASASSTATALVATPPANTVAASVTGTANVGQTLTASPGTWTGTPAPTLTYQWRTCDGSGGNCADLPAQTGQTYLLAAADQGNTIRVVVSGANSQGSATSTSTQTAAVGAAFVAPLNTALPTVSGTTTVGQSLSASAGTWTGNPTPTTSISWQRCTGGTCTTVASGSSYTPVAADAGRALRVSVTGTNSQGSATVTSAQTSAITAAPAVPSNTVLPAVSGLATVGQTLTGSAGTWVGNPTPTTSIEWQRCSGGSCTTVGTGSTYTLTSDDAGSTLRVAVTATNSQGSATANSGSSNTVASGSGGGGGGGGGGSATPVTSTKTPAATTVTTPAATTTPATTTAKTSTKTPAKTTSGVTAGSSKTASTTAAQAPKIASPGGSPTPAAGATLTASVPASVAKTGGSVHYQWQVAMPVSKLTTGAQSVPALHWLKLLHATSRRLTVSSALVGYELRVVVTVGSGGKAKQYVSKPTLVIKAKPAKQPAKKKKK
jgi:large repetitive protein